MSTDRVIRAIQTRMIGQPIREYEGEPLLHQDESTRVVRISRSSSGTHAGARRAVANVLGHA